MSEIPNANAPAGADPNAAVAVAPPAPAAPPVAAPAPEKPPPAPAPKAEAKPEAKKARGSILDAPDAAPSKYEFKSPEGKEPYASGVTTAWGEIASELGLAPEAAQQHLDKFATAYEEAGIAKFEQLQDGWLKEIKADKNIGGEKFEDSKQAVRRALQHINDPKLTAIMNGPWGYNPQLFGALRAHGLEISEDTIERGNAPAKSGDMDWDTFFSKVDSPAPSAAQRGTEW